MYVRLLATRGGACPVALGACPLVFLVMSAPMDPLALSLFVTVTPPRLYRPGLCCCRGAADPALCHDAAPLPLLCVPVLTHPPPRPLFCPRLAPHCASSPVTPLSRALIPAPFFPRHRCGNGGALPARALGSSKRAASSAAAAPVAASCPGSRGASFLAFPHARCESLAMRLRAHVKGFLSNLFSATPLRVVGVVLCPCVCACHPFLFSGLHSVHTSCRSYHATVRRTPPRGGVGLPGGQSQRTSALVKKQSGTPHIK